MSITLQSTIGGFTPEFMRKLPLLERAMLAHGLEPSQFVISKDRATPPTVPLIGPFFYDYTVFVGDDKFSVTEPNHIKFLEYFYQRCVAGDEPALEQEQPRRAGLISRMWRWRSRSSPAAVSGIYSPHCRARVASSQPSQYRASL